MKKNIAVMMKCFARDVISNIRIYILKMLAFYPFCLLFVVENASLSYLQYLFCWISLVLGVVVFLFFYCERYKKWYGICCGVLVLVIIGMWDGVNKYEDFEYKKNCLLYGGSWDSLKKECVEE